MPKIKGGKVKSMAGLKAQLKKGAGGQYLTRVPADGAMTVRFLTEPEDWYGYYEHFDQVRKFYPCSDDCPGCTEGDRPSGRYLANALDVTENRVVPLVLAKTAVSSLVKKHEKYGTLLDRDYEIARSGQGFDTEYDVTPEAPTKMNLTRYDLIDLEDVLQSQLEMAESGTQDDIADDDDDDTPPAPKPRGKSKAKAVAPVEDDDDDEPEDDADDEESEGDEFTRDELMAMSLADLKGLAKEVGYEASDVRGKDKDALADLILGGEDEGDDDADAGADDADEDDEEELTEEQLRAMPLAKVKALARELGIRIKSGQDKDGIIDLILDAAGEDSDDEEDAPPF